MAARCNSGASLLHFLSAPPHQALQEGSARESLATLVLTDENPAEVEFQGTVVRLIEVLDGTGRQPTQTGASLALVPTEYSSFPYRLAECIEQHSITIWYSVSSILSMMIQHGGLERFEFRHLRTILFAGEVFPVKHLRGLMEKLPHVD